MDGQSSLPVPPHLTSTQKAKVKDGSLPVGGAPPVDIPRFDQLPRRTGAMPAQREAEQMPQPNKRAAEEIKADFLAAQAALEQAQKTGQAPAATGTPGAAQGIQDAVDQPWPPKEPMPQQAQAPVQSEAPAEGEGPTVGDVQEHNNEFGWNAYHAALQESNFDTPELRRAIEGRCPEISIEDLILTESVTQRHLIIPGKLEVVFRSLTTEEDMSIKKYMYELTGSDRYILDSLTLMTLTCGLVSFNDAPMPDHRIRKDGEEETDKDLLAAKMVRVKGLPLSIISLLTVVYTWFDQRVRKQLVVEALGKS